jgi:hypothetical protein
VTVVNIRIPVALVQRLNRSIDTPETATGLATTQGARIRHALQIFAESKRISDLHTLEPTTFLAQRALKVVTLL